MKELEKLGIINADGQPTDLADAWRQDANDPKVIASVLETAYPDSLRQLAPPGDLDREKVVRWFQGEKLGIGAAKNKAATYLMVASGMTHESPRPSPTNGPKKLRERAAAKVEMPARVRRESPRSREAPKPQLAVNVQIHISADASTEQIDAIFSAMRRYFDESESA